MERNETQPGVPADRLASLRSARVYHDTRGVTWSRDEMLANTEKYVCGRYRRELVPGTLRVFPIKDFGALVQGVHRFCRMGSDTCEGMADFVFIWRNERDTWEVTRVLSYGHRAVTEPIGVQQVVPADGDVFPD